MQAMKYQGYTGSIEASLEDGCLHGEILFITDLITFEGQTVKQLEANFHKAVEVYIAACKKRGKEPNKPFSGSFNVRIDPEEHRQAAMAAMNAGQSLNQFVGNAIRAALGEKAPESSVDVNQIAPLVNRYPISNMTQTVQNMTVPEASRGQNS